jgi:uncharacterized repeat protein (TIGR03803 family)
MSSQVNITCPFYSPEGEREVGEHERTKRWRRNLALIFGIWLMAMDVQSQTFTTLYSFNNSDGSDPYAGLIQGNDGNFYGTTLGGGNNAAGTVFRITPNGILTTLHSFQGSAADGGAPQAGVVQGSDGNFYGTTDGGSVGFGTIFKITTGGVLTTLHSFTDGADGAYSDAGLVQGSDSNFYGTTSSGGTSGNGTVFRITPGGALTTLHSFTGQDGWGASGLVQGSNGIFYGTTSYGGSSVDGTVFTITSNGVLTTLHSFTGGGDGGEPIGSLVKASDGKFYGTTSVGGANGYGTVFKITSGGVLTPLYSYTGQAYGANRVTDIRLIQGCDSNFYGATECGGTTAKGTVFKITPGGVLTTMHAFTGVGADGTEPEAGLVQGSDGYFYGTTSSGGADGYGTLFRIGTPFTYLLTIQTNGSGIVTGATNGMYAGGTIFTLKANPATHYHLVNWTGTGLTGADTSSNLIVTLNQSKTITANFAIDQFTFANVGVQSNRFGFNITGTSNLVILVEGCTNLVNSIWVPVATNILTGGSAYFSDPGWGNYFRRFYRISFP